MSFVGEGGEEEAYYDGYYDENGEWIVNTSDIYATGIPEGHSHDDKGRLIDEHKKAMLFDGPEDPGIYLSIYLSILYQRYLEAIYLIPYYN
jgi:hypothetical protein